MANVQINPNIRSIKKAILSISTGNSFIFPRPRYSTIRSTMSTIRIEYPEREFEIKVVENGIKVYCNK